ncbi:MAG: Kae1-associated kinase Bud32 [Desulfurococcales archaeon]|nr:Kae1-associated kinase Bud32 [Desulfurococcales archaeon]
MVPYDPRRVLDHVRRSTVLLARGAESELRRGTLAGLKTVYKIRVEKPYMDPRLDYKLRRVRTAREAKVIAVALDSGVSAPRLYMVLPSIGLIAMEYIEGPRLKEALWAGAVDPAWAGVRAGRVLARLHLAGIVHGDPTTSNYIVRGDELVLIDYGLSEFSKAVEDRAVDLHLFRRAVEATHARIAESVYTAFLEGYREVMGSLADPVMERVGEISLRGRYVEERRKSVWGV